MNRRIDTCCCHEAKVLAGTAGPDGRIAMAHLIAIGYPDEKTAGRAAKEALRLADELVLQADAVATIVRDREGHYHVTTNHHAVGSGASWGMFWGMLFGLLFFVPVFGMAVGSGLGALMAKVEQAGIDKTFQRQVRDMIQPGSSAVFLVADDEVSDKAVAALGAFPGTVLQSTLSDEAEAQLQRELHGEAAAV
jgi:uncharacterized membrane protein